MNTVTTIIGLVVGALILGAGFFFFAKEKQDKESRKIYGITAAVGAAIVIGIVIKILVAGL